MPTFVLQKKSMLWSIFPVFLASLSTRTYTVGVGQSCTVSIDCTATNTLSFCLFPFTPASCSNGACACNTGYTGSTCSASAHLMGYHEVCTKNTDCGTGFTCSQNLCTCAISTYVYSSVVMMCLASSLKVLGDTCDQTADCYNSGGAIDGITCSTTCQCAPGHVARNGLCHIPHYGESCSITLGCAPMTIPYANMDGSRLTETCQSGTCACPATADTLTQTVDEVTYIYCLEQTTTTLKADGATCAQSNECYSKLCSGCLDGAAIKRCVRISTSSAASIKATVDVFWGVFAVAITSAFSSRYHLS